MAIRSITGSLLLAFWAIISGVQAAEPATPVRSVGAWRLVDTQNFSVCTPREIDPVEVARRCEALRAELVGAWGSKSPAWTPRCYIVWHPSEASYVRDVGPGSQQTRGSSVVSIDRGRVTARRIDLRGDRPDPLREALPHELTHVLVADYFLDKPCPRWAEEGLAVMADSPRKCGGHRRDLADGLRRDATLTTPELLRLDGYPPGHQRAVFYGQSLSLVEFLVGREDTATFLGFVRLATEQGYDVALHKSYGISDVGELDRQWRAQLAAPNVAVREK